MSVAEELGLRLHKRDSFKGWDLPQRDGELINLIIAVSFGLFVPSRILGSAQYGGINVHPSLLPDFRGAAPLQHTLLAGEERTGVTLQTLDPKHFDHGRILAQESFPIPNSDSCTHQQLLELVTPKAAALLVQGIRDRAFESSSDDCHSGHRTLDSPRVLRKAPKITSEDRHIYWPIGKDEIIRRERVLGRLWCLLEVSEGKTKRIVFHGIESVPLPEIFRDILDGKEPDDEFRELRSFEREDKAISIPFIKQGDHVVLFASRHDAILIKEITMDGAKKMAAARALDFIPST